MRPRFSPVFCLTVLLLILVGLSGCTEYWWTRGQPPGVGELVSRSTKQLNEGLKAGKRPELTPLVQLITTSLGEADRSLQAKNSVELHSQIAKVEDAFIELEPLLSIESRAPFSELSGQLRVYNELARSSGEIKRDPFNLFRARTQFFLASELSVPAPDLPRS